MQLFKEDLVHFLSHPGTKIESKKVLHSQLGVWEIRDIANGPPPNSFERIAYLDNGDDVFLLILSSQRADLIRQYYGTFDKFILAVQRTNKSELFNLILKKAKNDENNQKQFFSSYQGGGLNLRFSLAMQRCFPQGGAPGKPFQVVLAVDQVGNVVETVFNRDGADLDCMKSQLIGYHGQPPPYAPFHFDYQISFK